MYARVTYVQAPEGTVESGLRIWYETILPITMAREGFRGVVSLANRQTGKALSITMWALEKELVASTEAEYHKAAIAKHGEFFELAHAPENYEVHWFAGPVFTERAQEEPSTAAQLGPEPATSR